VRRRKLLVLKINSSVPASKDLTLELRPLRHDVEDDPPTLSRMFGFYPQRDDLTDAASHVVHGSEDTSGVVLFA